MQMETDDNQQQKLDKAMEQLEAAAELQAQTKADAFASLVSVTARSSVICALAGSFAVVFGKVFLEKINEFNDTEFEEIINIYQFSDWLGSISGILIISSLSLAAIALVGTTLAIRTVGFAGKGSTSITNLLSMTLSLVLSLVLIFSGLWRSNNTQLKIDCSKNLAKLSKQMQKYANNKSHLQYPEPEMWCDILLKMRSCKEEDFICPAAAKGRGHYAMNPDAKWKPEKPLVLLFEAKPGWNQTGQSDSLCFENHKPKGAHVLLTNGKVKFVTKIQAQKLIWK